MSYFGSFALKAKATLISDDPFFGARNQSGFAVRGFSYFF